MPTNKVAEWSGWLKLIADDVRTIQWSKQVWTYTSQLLRERSDLEPSGVFFGWLADVYASSQAVRIRRQTDRDKRAVSLIRLLLDVAAEPGELSRARHIDLYVNGSVGNLIGRNAAQRVASDEFTRLAGHGGDELHPSTPEADLESLQSGTDAIRLYVNRQVAHPDQRGVEAVPSFNELNQAIELITTITEKYLLLVDLVSESLIPEPQMDWTAVFSQAWLPSETSVD